jgi:hypothetical protein
VLAAFAGRTLASAAAGTALALLVIWIVLYVRVSAPINRTLTAAEHTTPNNARDLQHQWDRVITPRAILQALAVLALCMNLLN